MYIRPGAEGFVVSLLQATRWTCAMAIFTGLVPQIGVPMVKELLKISTNDSNWVAEQEDQLPPSVVNEAKGIRVYIIARTERYGQEIQMSDEQSLKLLHCDFGNVWEVLNSKGYNFHNQNTLLVGSLRDGSLCPENVLGVKPWFFGDTTDHMKNVQDRIMSLFYEQPHNITTWLKPGI